MTAKPGRFFTYQHDPKDPPALANNSVVSLLIRQAWDALGGNGGWRVRSLRFDNRAFLFLLDRSSDFMSGGCSSRIEPECCGWVVRKDGYASIPATKQVTAYHHDPGDPQSLSNNRVNAIREDRQETAVGWHQKTGSICWIEIAAKAIVSRQRMELKNNVIKSILEDRRGYLWLGTHNGLSRFDRQRRTFRNYSESDGLASNLLGLYAAEGSRQTPRW